MNYILENNSYSIITNIEEAVRVGAVCARSWFRGHPKIYDHLDPKIFRGFYIDEAYSKFRTDSEQLIIEEFKRVAPSLYSKIPLEGNNLDWLVLMQHYGAPTRLLDWTESILIALYFAVKKSNESDGEMWVLYPLALNKKSAGFYALPLRNNAFLQYLVSEMNYPENKKTKLTEQLQLDGIPKYPLAFYPTLNFTRMVVQSSVFTIHPKPQEENRIEDILESDKFLFRYIIPAKHKKKILEDLNALNIKNHKLFPDLDHLAQDLITESSIVAYSPPTPPKFKN